MTERLFLALTAEGGRLARRLAEALGGDARGLSGRTELPAFDDLEAELQAAFQAGRAIVGVCSAAILIRKLAPLLADKTNEPPVLALAEDGSAVVPLLGGHRGANDLARQIARELGIEAAVTTAGDNRFGLALDVPPDGWRLANPGDAKAVMAAILGGAAARLEGDMPWLEGSRLPIRDEGAVRLSATVEAEPGDETHLVYHPARLCLGVGCERDAPPEFLDALVSKVMAGLAPQALAGVFSIDVKADETAVLALGAKLGVENRFFDAVRLEAETPRLANPSDVVFAEVGCHGVAEAAALAAAGPGGQLIRPKVKGDRCTAAVALAPAAITALPGRARGRLSIIGIGPGRADWRTPEADAWVREASDLVGYGLYLDLLGEAGSGKDRHGYQLGEEIDRCRRALDLAAEGRKVALICSGDAGIYAMAALVFELLDREATPAWGRVDIRVTPGISALQAAAARAGAPLGHDFCAISLSDLLTPWEAIEARLRAAAEGDFVVAFYNPVSKRRRTQLARAKAILLGHRPPSTPVIVARQLGRPDEDLTVTTLADLDPETIDMLTLVMVGASTSRVVAGRVYTPRGYEKKRVEEAS